MTIKYDDINIGDQIPAYTSAPLTRTDLVRYAGASGDFNPLHYDNKFVELIGLERVIAQGMLIMGIAGEAVTTWVDNKNLRKFNVSFSGMTEPADFNDYENTKQRATITVTGKVTKKYEEAGEKRIRCEIIAQNGLNNTKLSGYFIAALP